MKTTPFLTPLFAALALPTLALAQDKAAPGKASDAPKNPPAEASGRVEPGNAAKAGQRDPGKASDGVKEPGPTANDKPFSGSITAMSKEMKTITVTDSSSAPHMLHIGPTSKLKRGDKEATWDDLKVGEKVKGTASSKADKMHVEMLTIGG